MIYTILQDRYLRGNSSRWKNRMSTLSFSTCYPCAHKHGTIISMDTDEASFIPEHENCRCQFVRMRTKEVGTATEKGIEGADMYLIYRNRLPDYYCTKKEALAAGWKKTICF